MAGVGSANAGKRLRSSEVIDPAPPRINESDFFGGKASKTRMAALLSFEFAPCSRIQHIDLAVALHQGALSLG